MLPKVEIIGKDPTGKSIVCGLFKLFDTTGIPLYVVFEGCKQHDWIPSWIHFYHEASDVGWKHKTITNRLRSGMEDVYEKEFINNVIDRLDKIFKD